MKKPGKSKGARKPASKSDPTKVAFGPLQRELKAVIKSLQNAEKALKKKGLPEEPKIGDILTIALALQEAAKCQKAMTVSFAPPQ